MFLFVIAIFAPLLTAIEGHGPLTVNNSLVSQGSLDLSTVPGMPLPGYKFPSASHWLGVEPVNGRDIFARLVYGARVSLTIALLATLMSVVLGTLLGAMAAYFRGAVDSVISRFMDLLAGVPATAADPDARRRSCRSRLGNTFLGKGSTLPIVSLVLILGFFGWPYFGRIVRGQVLSLREREFVEAARALGARPRRIVIKEIIPNVVAVDPRLCDAGDPDEHHRRGRTVVPWCRSARSHAVLGPDAQRVAERELVPDRPMVHVGTGCGTAAHGAGLQPVRRRGQGRARPSCEPRLNKQTPTSTPETGLSRRIRRASHAQRNGDSDESSETADRSGCGRYSDRLGRGLLQFEEEGNGGGTNPPASRRPSSEGRPRRWAHP